MELENLDNKTGTSKDKNGIYRVFLGFIFPFLLNFGYVSSSAVYLLMPVIDRENKTRQMLSLNGINSLAYWLGIYICDLILFLFPTCLFLIIVKVMNLAAFGSDIDGLLLILLGFGVSFITYTYMMSFLFKNVTQAVKCLMPAYLLFGTALPLVATFIVSAVGKSKSI